MSMKKRICLLLAMVGLIAGLTSCSYEGSFDGEILQTEGVSVVPTMKDEVTSDTAWCGTFQLVWNDMKNEVVKKDIEFNPQEKMAENLNLEEFTEDMLSEEYYFKKYGLKTLELKEEIEKGIKEKFDQTSDILNDFDWSEEELNNPNDPDMRRYFFYVMLYRKFEFLKEFSVLPKGMFGNKYENVEYFGIDSQSDESLDNQVQVLYYHSQDDFAVLLRTKNKDEVILCKSPKGDTFEEIYENVNTKSANYTGSKVFKAKDLLKVPKLDFNLKREYTELENKPFKTADPVYDMAEIAKAIQTIQFSLDEKGGKIKSEAAIDVKNCATAVAPNIEEPRYFYVDDTFAIFLREEGREIPYFAARIDNITKFNESATLITAMNETNKVDELGKSGASNEVNSPNGVKNSNEVKNPDEVKNSNEVNKNDEICRLPRKPISHEQNGTKLSVTLPEGWKYVIFTPSEGEDYFEYGMRLYPEDIENAEKCAEIYYYTRNLGVCGTGLSHEIITLNDGSEAEVGYYDGNKNWSFVSFFNIDLKLSAMNNGLTDEEAQEALEIMKTVQFEKDKTTENENI